MSKQDLPEPTEGQGPWRKYLCRACGLIYNEGEGDPDGGLAPGTRFDDIPDDWVCPVCGVGKGDFEPYERPSAPAAMAAQPAIGKSDIGVVIVGAGLAGWATARALRDLDPDRPITIVTACPGHVYNKPEISRALSRKADADALQRATGPEEAARLGIRLIPHTHVVGLSPQFRRLRTTRGTIPFTHLVLALGARSKIPNGLDPHHCWRINSLDAWRAFHARLGDRPRRVAIVGGGMIGCELAEDFARAGHHVQLVGRGALPLDTLIPAEAGQRLLAGLRRAGVDFIPGQTVANSTRAPDGTVSLTLGDGRVLSADRVVAATGLALDTRFLRNAGLDVSPAGITVESRTLSTGIEGIYGLGDCVAIDGAPCRFIEPIPKQAEIIARDIVGVEHSGYRHRAPIIRLKSVEVPLTIEGAPHAKGEWRVIVHSPEALEMERWDGDRRVARLTA
ncbi:rubredoxin [Citreimonas sp.]|uniref:rubredoxin n=1 Tax=Citreimonas sp. TaxID=3036715 RepID=UPI004058E6A3